MARPPSRQQAPPRGSSLPSSGRGRLAATLLLLLLGLAACSDGLSDKQRFHLAARRPGAAVSPCPCELHVGHIRVSPLFERTGFVYRTGEAAYSNDYYHEFRAPPGILLRAATVDWLERARLFREILDPRDADGAEWVLEGEVVKLYGDLRDESTARGVLEVDFNLLRVEGTRLQTVWRRSYGAAARAAARHPEAIADAWQKSLARVLGQLEADLHAALEAAGR